MTDQARTFIGDLPTSGEKARDWELASYAVLQATLALSVIDWEWLAKQLDRADALGPILLPSEYRDSLDNGTLDNNKVAVRAARAFLAELRDLVP